MKGRLSHMQCGLCAMKSILAHPTILGFSYPNTTAIEPFQEVALWGYISQTLLVPLSGLFVILLRGYLCCLVRVCLHVCLIMIHENHLSPQSCLYLVDAHPCCHISWQKRHVPFRSRCAFAPIKISCSCTSFGPLRSTEWSKPWAFCPLSLLGDSTHSCLNENIKYLHGFQSNKGSRFMICMASSCSRCVLYDWVTLRKGCSNNVYKFPCQGKAHNTALRLVSHTHTWTFQLHLTWNDAASVGLD